MALLPFYFLQFVLDKPPQMLGHGRQAIGILLVMQNISWAAAAALAAVLKAGGDKTLQLGFQRPAARRRAGWCMAGRVSPCATAAIRTSSQPQFGCRGWVVAKRHVDFFVPVSRRAVANGYAGLRGSRATTGSAGLSTPNIGFLAKSCAARPEPGRHRLGEAFFYCTSR